MLHYELNEKYFEWLHGLVFGEGSYNSLSYRKLLMCLYNTDFTYIIDLDANRAQDGVDFRYRFGYDNGYNRSDIRLYLDNRPCNVLEMMVALAFKGEEQIMDDDDYGNRTGQWFWNMIVSLGLGSMNDRVFNEAYTNRVIARFLNRDYEPDGRGGLFTIENTRHDLRDIEIWTQFMWYLDEFLYY